MRNFCSLLCILLLVSGAVSSSTTSNGVTEEQQLKERLQKVLPKYRPPLDMVNNSVYVSMDLYQILDVDEKNGIITAKFWAYFYYFSEKSKWNASDYGGIKILLFPNNTFWSPDLC